LFDPASTSDAEQVQAMFEESISDLFEPGMHEWRQVTIPTDESHHDRYLLLGSRKPDDVAHRLAAKQHCLS
jgi:hypothetical protein